MSTDPFELEKGLRAMLPGAAARTERTFTQGYQEALHTRGIGSPVKGAMNKPGFTAGAKKPRTRRSKVIYQSGFQRGVGEAEQQMTNSSEGHIAWQAKPGIRKSQDPFELSKFMDNPNSDTYRGPAERKAIRRDPTYLAGTAASIGGAGAFLHGTATGKGKVAGAGLATSVAGGLAATVGAHKAGNKARRKAGLKQRNAMGYIEKALSGRNEDRALRLAISAKGDDTRIRASNLVMRSRAHRAGEVKPVTYHATQQKKVARVIERAANGQKFSPLKRDKIKKNDPFELAKSSVERGLALAGKQPLKALVPKQAKTAKKVTDAYKAPSKAFGLATPKPSAGRVAGMHAQHAAEDMRASMKPRKPFGKREDPFELAKNDLTRSNATVGRHVTSQLTSPVHGLVAGKKGHKLRAAGNELGGAVAGNIGGRLAGAALTRGKPVGAALGGLGGMVAGVAAGTNRAQNKGHYKPQKGI